MVRSRIVGPIGRQARLGVSTRADVERLGQRKVKVRVSADEDVDFARLAELMDRATATRPRFRGIAPVRSPDGGRVRIFGENLETIRPDRVSFNGRAVQASLGPDFLELRLTEPDPSGEVILQTRTGDHLRVRLVS